MKVLSAMTLGILVAIFGILVSGTTTSLYVLFLGILLFSIGEMLTGPKKSEYFALIAPQGKKALYLGYVNIPAAIGPAIGALMAGILYGTRGEKATLALRYLAEKTDLAKGKAWNGDVASLSDLLGVSRQDAFKTLQATLHIDATEATRLLWDTYQPYEIWYSFAVIGVVSLVGMLLFSRRSRRWKDLDV
jgi:proton-dependent oligopeptide transporter, POT family